MITVKLPNGTTAKFPDGTPPETMRAVIQRQFPPEQGAQQPVASPMPAGYNPANVQQLRGKVTPKAQPQAPRPDLMGSTAATISGFVNGIPIFGPMVQNTSDALVGVGSQLTGGDYGKTVEGLRSRRAELAGANPIADVAGNVAGTVATLGLGGATKVGAEALGLAGKFLPRVLNSTLSSAGISGADALVRRQDALPAMATGAAFGAGIPLAGGAIGQTIKAIGRKAAPLVGSLTNATGEAARRVGTAFSRDAKANPAMMLNAADEATAKGAGVPLVNVDRGGETVRALTRSVANQSPEARAVIENTASDRFAGQGKRAVDFVQRLAGGNVDDLALREGIASTARMVNNKAYKAAENAPAARAIWSPKIRQLMQSDLFQKAINEAESVGSDFAALGGVKAVKNPFVFKPDGTITLRKMPDGSTALPSLQFWDVVQRNLRKVADTARRAGDDETASRAGQLRTLLNAELDTAVPQFQKARQGAAAFFGAEDALEAGKKFATTPKLVPEAKAAFQKFTAPEQKAFQIGYASELIDRIKSVGDRSNVINQVFKTPASREMIELVFGKAKARELEAYVRVEDLADKLRGAMGNSTTARQLMELGIGAGTGAWLTGGDWKGALGGAALAKGARFVGQKVDDKVMQEVARLLLSNDPAMLKKAVFQAQMSEQWMNALELWGKRLEVAARGTSMALAS